MLFSKSLFNLLELIPKFSTPGVEYLMLLTSKKFITELAFIPKPIPSDWLLSNPETATAIKLPSSLTIGPPLFPEFIAASICI